MRRCLACLLLVGISTVGWGQVDLGLDFGLGHSGRYLKAEDPHYMRHGGLLAFRGGLRAELAFSDQWLFRTGLFFSHRGHKVAREEPRERTPSRHLFYLDLPFVLERRVSASNLVWVFGGAQVSYLLVGYERRGDTEESGMVPRSTYLRTTRYANPLPGDQVGYRGREAMHKVEASALGGLSFHTGDNDQYRFELMGQFGFIDILGSLNETVYTYVVGVNFAVLFKKPSEE